MGHNSPVACFVSGSYVKISGPLSTLCPISPASTIPRLKTKYKSDVLINLVGNRDYKSDIKDAWSDFLEWEFLFK